MDSVVKIMTEGHFLFMISFFIGFLVIFLLLNIWIMFMPTHVGNIDFKS